MLLIPGLMHMPAYLEPIKGCIYLCHRAVEALATQVSVKAHATSMTIDKNPITEEKVNGEEVASAYISSLRNITYNICI